MLVFLGSLSDLLRVWDSLRTRGAAYTTPGGVGQACCPSPHFTPSKPVVWYMTTLVTCSNIVCLSCKCGEVCQGSTRGVTAPASSGKCQVSLSGRFSHLRQSWQDKLTRKMISGIRTVEYHSSMVPVQMQWLCLPHNTTRPQLTL
jgi:hypothetical protein